MTARAIGVSSSRVVTVLALALAFSLGVVRPADPRGPDVKRPVVIGAVTESWGPPLPIVGLRDGLIDLGYRENDDFVMGVRFTQGDVAALPEAARDLVRQGVDVLVASPSAMARLDPASLRIPIILLGGGDPLAHGLIKSYARPGGNVTGVTTQTIELAPKRLELFRQAVRNMKRVLYVHDAHDATTAQELAAYRAGARQLGLQLVERPVRTQDEARTALDGLRRTEIHGIVAPISVSLNIPGFVVVATSRQLIPTMFSERFYVEQGALASYGADAYGSGRQAARLVDKIVRGAKPGDIPVEAYDRVEFALNMKVARALKLTIPRDLLHRVDRVVE